MSLGRSELQQMGVFKEWTFTAELHGQHLPDWLNRVFLDVRFTLDCEDYSEEGSYFYPGNWLLSVDFFEKLEIQVSKTIPNTTQRKAEHWQVYLKNKRKFMFAKSFIRYGYYLVQWYYR